MGDQYQFSTQLHKVILNYLLNLHLDLLIVKLFIPRVDAFYLFLLYVDAFYLKILVRIF